MLWLLVSTLYAETFFVGPNGEAENPGTRLRPLASLQVAVDRCGPGDECIVLPGTYGETIKLSQRGAPEAPVLIRAEGEVVLDGTDPIDEPWEPYRGNIVRTRLPGPEVVQAFSAGIPLSLARWPNARFEETWIRSTWARAAEGSEKDLMICDELAATGIDWSGAVAVLNVGHQYKTWTRTILTHGLGQRSFTYRLDERLGDGKDSGKSWWNDRFFLTGTIKALDVAGEFFHDVDSGYFYLATDDGTAPAPGSLRVKRRDYGIVGTGVADVHIKGFRFFGCTLLLKDVTRTIVEQCVIRFPACTMMIGETMPQGSRFPTPATAVYGNNNILRGLVVSYSSGHGIVAAGRGNRVEDCIVHDVCWSGTIDHAGIAIKPYQCDVTASTASHCTVYNVGNIGISYRGGSNVVEYCHVHHTGLACQDIAAIHTGGSAAAGSVARYNWVHNSMGLGIRGDDQTRELTVHHNLVWDCDQGVIVKGDHNKVYNNTILGSDGHGRLTIPTREEPKKWWTRHPILPVQNANSLFFNNYCEAISYRYKPLAQNAGISHNITYGQETTFLSALVKADASARESGRPDARPRKDSPIIDKGKVVEGLTDGCTGKAPDVGAYEYGMPAWRAGALRPTPADIVLPIAADVARSWELKPDVKVSIPLPRKLLDSRLSEPSKSKLKALYDSCWEQEELDKRRGAIQLRGEPGSEAYSRHQKIVIELHRKAYGRLVDRAPTVLSGNELALFYSLSGKE